MLLELARSRQILFFGGKGGVGKTTVAAATALARAEEGARVLLVSTDPAHNLGHLFDRPIGANATRVTQGLDAVEIDPAGTVDVHLGEVARALHQLMPVDQHKEIDRHMELSRSAPGMQEAAILERMADVVDEGLTAYDLIVFDTAPSGHTARLMVLPEMMSAWTEGLIKRRERADRFAGLFRDLGRDDAAMADKTLSETDAEQTRESRIRQILLRRRAKFSKLRDRLADQATTSFVIVLAAERLPVLESIELQHQLQHAGIAVNGLVINKRSPQNAGTFLEERRRQEDAHLETLAEALPTLPRQDITLMAQDVVGLEAVSQLGMTLAQA